MATLKATRLYADDRQTVIVINTVDIRHEQTDAALGLYASSKPVAVVVSAASGTRAIDMNAEPLDLDRLLDDAGEVGALLER